MGSFELGSFSRCVKKMFDIFKDSKIKVAIFFSKGGKYPSIVAYKSIFVILIHVSRKQALPQTDFPMKNRLFAWLPIDYFCLLSTSKHYG